jgi:2-polyprenyl-3-methyl-5-hydroxy-6-metoxy-1,4-benzoquinol methylase
MKKLHQSTQLKTASGETLHLSGSSYGCPVCGSTEKRRVKYSFPPFDMAECAVCNTLHLSPIPTPELLAQIYNSNYYHDADLEHGYFDYAADAVHIARTYHRRLLFVKPFLENITKPTVLEIGAALGFGLSEARDVLAANVLASDVSQEAIDACGKAGFSALLSDAYGTCEAIEPNSLDMVFAFDVIEHLPDMRYFTKWLKSVLKPGGLFFVTTPDMDHVLNQILGSRSPSIKIPQHITYFTTDTLLNTLKQGFSLVAHAWDFQYVGLGMLFSRLASIAGLPPFERKISTTVAVPNGMRMYVFRRETIE